MEVLKAVIIAAIFQYAAGQEKVCSSFCTSLGMMQSNPGKSCDDIYQINKATRGVSDYYWINTTTGVHQVYCDMELVCGGYKGGWMRVADLNMTRSEDNCPQGWGNITTLIPACWSADDSAGCFSTSFSVNGVRYHKICGQARGYQIGFLDAFGPEEDLNHKDIDDVYMDGLSITIDTPCKHVWTYVGGNNDDNYDPNIFPNKTDIGTCPCAGRYGSEPVCFIGSDFYCESGADGGGGGPVYTNDPLWDGSGCNGCNDNCCTRIGQPWFY